MTQGKPLPDLLNRLAAAEERFVQSDFLAPALPGGQLQVRIAGVVCRLPRWRRWPPSQPPLALK